MTTIAIKKVTWLSALDELGVALRLLHVPTLNLQLLLEENRKDQQ